MGFRNPLQFHLDCSKVVSMELKTWLDAERGRRSALAEFLEVSPGRVSQIADDGVPVKFMEKVNAFTKNEVTVAEMVRARTPADPAAEQS